MLNGNIEADRLEAGCDEAGRGCLAGPVVAAAVILPNDFQCASLNDSKVLSEKTRLGLRETIQNEAIAWAVAFVDNQEIDTLNILNASFEAMHRSVLNLSQKPDFLLIDGNRFNALEGYEHACFVKGDGRFLSIAAASILAKTYRDEYMDWLHDFYPHYGWKNNKAYPTKLHRSAIKKYGRTAFHRNSFQLLPQEQMKLEI
jgi:ribonuclease HII